MKFKEGPSTRSVHFGRSIDPITRSILPPIIENSAFAFEDLDTWQAVVIHEQPGDIYSRLSDPTTRIFEEKVAALEGAKAATNFATGMAAISTTLFALLSPGQRVVTIRDIYGGTYLHFTQILPRFNITCDICDTDDEEGLLTSIAKGCDMVFLESPTNPLLKVIDLKLLFDAAHDVGAITLIDNTFATPINQTPIALGADLVVHSATKYLSGHGDVTGGIVCGQSDLVEIIRRHRELTGPSLDAHSASLLFRNLKTLALRVHRQNENAMAMARFLEAHPMIERVHYPGLENHPGHEIAKKQMSGFGGVLSFEVKGGLNAISKFLPRLKYAYLAANLGQVETVVGPPAMTSHAELSPEERQESGVPESLVRYAVGIEDINDLKEDMEQALSIL